MNHWLMKTEPGEYSFTDLERDGKTHWDGVRNHQAQKNMRAMAFNDSVLIYHSMGPKEVVGIAKVCKEAYPDPEAKPNEKWILVDIKPVEALKKPVHLHTIKATESLEQIALIRQSRLSVMPLTEDEFKILCTMGNA